MARSHNAVTYVDILLNSKIVIVLLWGLPLITYAHRGRGGGGGVKPPIHFYCVLHAKRGGGGANSM